MYYVCSVLTALLKFHGPRRAVHIILFRMNENMEFPGISGDDIEWLQEQFVKSIKVNFI